MELGLHYAVILPIIGIIGVALSLASLASRDWRLHKAILERSIQILLVGWLIYMIPFITLDYRLAEVAENSSNGLSMAIRIATSWSGGGSSLYFMSTVTGLGVLYILRRGNTPNSFTASAAISLLVILLAALLNGAFDVTRGGGGMGLNPLLKSYWIIPHPLTTFGGYALLLVGALALLSGVRRGLVLFLLGWSLLSMGITLGAYWSYETFGWGGYWAWDPVEIAELVVWLAAVAALHSIGPLEGLRKTMLLMLASSVPLALYVTRSGLSPLHSFASANIGSIILLSLSIGYLGLALYTLVSSDGASRVIEGIRRAFRGRIVSQISIIIAGLLLIVISLFVYASLLAPSILTAISINAMVPTMSEGVRFYHPVLYPLFLVAIAFLPGYFLAKEIGGKGFLSMLVITGILAVTSYVAVDKAVIQPAPMAPRTTNIMIMVGLAVSSIVLGSIVISILYPLYTAFKRRRIPGSQYRLLSIKLIHLGVVLVFIGVLLSGTYAFNDTYFETYKIPLNGSVDVGGATIELVDYKFERGQGVIDLYTHVAGKRNTAFLAWQAINLLKMDVAPAIKDVKLALEEVSTNASAATLRELLVDRNTLKISQNTTITGVGDILINDIVTGTNETIAMNTSITITFIEPNMTIDMTPIVSDSGELEGAWLSVGVGGTRALLLSNMSEARIAGTHSYYTIIFRDPAELKLGNITIRVKEAALYPDLPGGNGSIGFGKPVEGGLEINVPYMLVVEGELEYRGQVYQLPGRYERGLYLYIVMERGDAVVLEETMKSTLSNMLSDTGLFMKMSSSIPGRIPLPREVLEGARLKLTLKISEGGETRIVEPVIRFEANGEALGIHGLVTDTIIIGRGLSDLYINVQPPHAQGFFNTYHELLVYYLSEARHGLKPEEYLSLVGVMAAGYNIGSVTGMSHVEAGFQVEQAMIDLYLLAEKYDPASSNIKSDGITIMVKVVPGVDLIWIGVAVMAVSGLFSAWFYSRRV